MSTTPISAYRGGNRYKVTARKWSQDGTQKVPSCLQGHPPSELLCGCIGVTCVQKHPLRLAFFDICNALFSSSNPIHSQTPRAEKHSTMCDENRVKRFKARDDICQRAGQFTPGLKTEGITPTKDDGGKKPKGILQKSDSVADVPFLWVLKEMRTQWDAPRPPRPLTRRLSTCHPEYL